LTGKEGSYPCWIYKVVFTPHIGYTKLGLWTKSRSREGESSTMSVKILTFGLLVWHLGLLCAFKSR
jgi:hypothetical protein